MKIIRACVATLAILPLTRNHQAKAPPKTFVVDSAWLPTKIASDSNGSTIVFRNGRRLQVDLSGVVFLGQLPRRGRAPMLLLGGWGCSECDIEAQVYPIPADTQKFSYGQRGAYYYPGSMRGAGVEPTDTLDFWRGRLFVGACLDGGVPVAVWFERDRDTIGVWRPNVYRLTIGGDSAIGSFMRPPPSLNGTLRTVRAGKCYEIPGKRQVQY